MNKKIFVALITLLFLSSISYATNYSVIEQSIRIQINLEENDKIEERFYLFFSDEQTKIDFREKSIELGPNLDKWKEFDSLFQPSVIENTLNKKISYNEGTQNYLLLSYELSDSFVAKRKETNMVTEYVIKANYFNSFYQTGLWIIPTNTKIIIELPPGAEINEDVEPTAIITSQGNRKIVTWEGYKSANKLSLQYIVWNKMDSLIDLNKSIEFLFETNNGRIILGSLLLLIILVLWQRKKITEKIEEFVENNSVIQEE